jgi:hypothetical protein
VCPRDSYHGNFLQHTSDYETITSHVAAICHMDGNR